MLEITITITIDNNLKLILSKFDYSGVFFHLIAMTAIVRYSSGSLDNSTIFVSITKSAMILFFDSVDRPAI